MGPGKAFGELAILYNCTRTASIKGINSNERCRPFTFFIFFCFLVVAVVVSVVMSCGDGKERSEKFGGLMSVGGKTGVQLKGESRERQPAGYATYFVVPNYSASWSFPRSGLDGTSPSSLSLWVLACVPWVGKTKEDGPTSSAFYVHEPKNVMSLASQHASRPYRRIFVLLENPRWIAGSPIER